MSAALDAPFDRGQKGQAAAALLVRKGDLDEIAQVGRQSGSRTVVYVVAFELNKVVGCLESEWMRLDSIGATR